MEKKIIYKSSQNMRKNKLTESLHTIIEQLGWTEYPPGILY